jgi:CRP-like cAMP-binding protein
MRSTSWTSAAPTPSDVGGDLVRVDRPDGERVDLGPGAFFGELAVLAEVPRTARVSALTDLRCLAISRNDLVELLDREPGVAVSMLCEVARRLAEVT